jgi:hypothetical protein
MQEEEELCDLILQLYKERLLELEELQHSPLALEQQQSGEEHGEWDELMKTLLEALKNNALSSLA